METLLLNQDAVDENTQMPELIRAIEDAFAAYALGDAQMPAKSYIDLPQYNGDFRSMPAYLDADDWDAAGIKWVNVHPDNPEEFDLPTVMGTMIYSDPETAFPLAIMDGTELTMKRTGAAAAVATDHLAVEDATSMGLVGAGVQSYTQLEAISKIRPIEEVVISDLDDEAVAEFIDYFSDEFDVRAGSIAEAASCDILSTVTPVETPLDDHAQTTHSGEINVPYNEGTLTDGDIHGDIGDIVIGELDGRTEEDGVTVFDSTGLAIQDVAAAHVVYEHANENDNGYPFNLLGQ
jgi:alanine dehydrogenase